MLSTPYVYIIVECTGPYIDRIVSVHESSVEAEKEKEEWNAFHPRDYQIIEKKLCL